MLRQDILDQTCVTPSMKPREVFATRPELYEPYKKNFANNLHNLRAQLTREQDRANDDHAIFLHDRQVHPRKLHAPQGYPRWDLHPAKNLLKSDMDSIEKEERPKATPMELRMSRPEYLEFPLDVFRNHIHQEYRSRRERPYWIYQKAQK